MNRTLSALLLALALAACGRNEPAATVPADSAAADTSIAADLLRDLSALDVLRSDPRFSTFVAALDSANLSATLESPGAFTVFAPTNAAFRAVGEGQISAWRAAAPGAARLRSVLLHHVARGILAPARLPDSSAVATLGGGPLVLRTRAGRIVQAGSGRVASESVRAGNGLVYVIDAVQVPGADSTAAPR